MPAAATQQTIPAKNPSEVKIEPMLLDQFATEGSADFFVWMKEKADLRPAYQMDSKQEKGRYVYAALLETANRTQQALRTYLDKLGMAYESFYIANKILVRAGSETLAYEIAGRADVEKITANHLVQLPEPLENPDLPVSPAAVEPNIAFVNADDVWALGYDGSGVVVAAISSAIMRCLLFSIPKLGPTCK